jgi:hypothetical protein
MDVKGRSTSLTFQSECVVHTSGLNKIVNEDVKSTIDNAQDFRKLCPLQKMGLDGVPTGGYSEDEINHIQSLVDSQEQEIQELSVEWKQEISRLQEVQDEALKKQEEFATIYNSVAQELALSEGLGQRYGAPRRRAQERLRTEQARDEQSAGKIDELLAKLDFELNEGRRRFDTMHTNKSMTTETGSSIEEKQFGPDKNGRIELDHINYVWSIVSALRSSLDQRALYLQVYPEGKRPDTSEIPWISPDLIPSVTDPADSSNQAVASIPSAPISFSVIVDEAEADCKKETVQLYESEGRGATIKNLPGGVPESLTIWLQETRQKLLGPGGHREKSWKRLWRQIDTLDALLSRKTGPLEAPEPRLGVPGMSLREFQSSFSLYTNVEKIIREQKFGKTVSVLEKCRDKHDRLLRPRLGSPDAVDELNNLDNIEKQRSSDLTNAVIKFRSSLIKRLATIAKQYVENVGLISSSYISILDNTARLEVLEIPPDTEVPKKRMTLKKLRKAERIKDAVAAGAEDTSKSRVWPGIDTTKISQVLRGIDDLILSEDKEVAQPIIAAPDPKTAPKGKTAKGAVAEPAVVVPEECNPASIVTDSWLRQVKDNSAKRGLVSSAHRLLISERDEAISQYFDALNVALCEIRTSYDVVLEQESSWVDRWTRQIDSLRKGVV